MGDCGGGGDIWGSTLHPLQSFTKGPRRWAGSPLRAATVREAAAAPRLQPQKSRDPAEAAIIDSGRRSRGCSPGCGTEPRQIGAVCEHWCGEEVMQWVQRGRVPAASSLVGETSRWEAGPVPGHRGLRLPPSVVRTALVPSPRFSYRKQSCLCIEFDEFPSHHLPSLPAPTRWSATQVWSSGAHGQR